MRSSGPVHAPPRLVASIIAITILPLAAFLWLGWKFLEQDRVTEAQQGQERLQLAADRIVATLDRAIADAEQGLTIGRVDWPDGAVAVRFAAHGVEVAPAGRVAFLPVVERSREIDASRFRDAELFEFQRNDRRAAVAAYRRLAGSADAAMRAGALLRLARNLRFLGAGVEALLVYGELQRLDGGITEAGVPVALAAGWGRCVVLDALGRTADLRAEAARLHADLLAGRWPIVEAVYRTYELDARRWAGAPSQTRDPELFAAAISRLWREGPLEGAGRSRREVLTLDGGSVGVISPPPGAVPRMLLTNAGFVEMQWLKPAWAVAAEHQVGFQLDGVHTPARVAAQPLAGAPPGVAPVQITLTSAQSNLPWRLTVASTSPGAASGLAVRRRLLIGGFALLATLMLSAGWLILRAVGREMAVARLQSDFVAAVSHEFRTPLTTLQQFTEMLREQPALTEQRRRICYEAQARATERLTRLVETVLDFGRIEAGARPYHFEPRDCAVLVERVVDDFRVQPHAASHPITFAGYGAVGVEADEDALARAVWNLLDNAVKYSPAHTPIDVGVSRTAGEAAIAVRDRGLGIPPGEQRRIFTRFQRGEQALTLGIKGTGIGLAMVDQIVRAHQGRVELESAADTGSTFTIFLPAKG